MVKVSGTMEETEKKPKTFARTAHSHSRPTQLACDTNIHGTGTIDGTLVAAVTRSRLCKGQTIQTIRKGLVRDAARQHRIRSTLPQQKMATKNVLAIETFAILWPAVAATTDECGVSTIKMEAYSPLWFSICQILLLYCFSLRLHTHLCIHGTVTRHVWHAVCMQTSRRGCADRQADGQPNVHTNFAPHGFESYGFEPSPFRLEPIRYEPTD